jgi:hypothetical protein
MTLLIKTITSILKVLTYIVTSDNVFLNFITAVILSLLLISAFFSPAILCPPDLLGETFWAVITN